MEMQQNEFYKRKMPKPKLIGISGITNGGKTTLSNSLLNHYTNSVVLSQDDFYHPRDQNHLQYLPEFKSLNFDVISAINMNKLKKELECLIQSDKYEFIFLDGFLLFRDQTITDILDKKYFLVLNRDECLRRRLNRTYKTSDTIPYFDKVVWSEFLKYKSYCESNYSDIIFLSGSNSKENILDFVISDLQSII